MFTGYVAFCYGLLPELQSLNEQSLTANADTMKVSNSCQETVGVRVRDNGEL